MKRRLIDCFGHVRNVAIVVSALAMSATLAFAQVQTKVSGRVVDANDQPLPGVAIMIEGSTGGTVTDFDGNYTLSVPEGSTLSFSFIGFESKKVNVVPGTKVYNVTMEDDSKELDEVVVVGYGQQKKASVVGAITQTTGEVLERAAGISDVGAALTGNLPGVITTSSSGMPGQEEPKIVIRGSSSPNGSDPLVLVDGIKRPMSSVDMASVATISVLKDASATAVYGVEGANGVILITTKRGQEGKAQVNVSFDATMKMVSKLPGKLDSWDAMMARNLAIEHELNLAPTSWSSVESQEFIDKFKNQKTLEDKERYPNVDWQDYLFKKHAMSYKANVNIAGGTKFVRYFASADYVNEGDMFKNFDNGRGYKTGFGFNKVTVRSNLDFQISPITVLKANIAGSTGIQKTTGKGGFGAGDEWQIAQQWAGAYNIAPDIFLPKYADGTWGFIPGKSNQTNSAQNIATGAMTKTTTSRITTDFVLEQDLKFITEGLSFNGLVAWDNVFRSSGYGITDQFNNPQTTYVNSHTGERINAQLIDGQTNNLPYYEPNKWSVSGGQVDNWATERNLNYQFRLFWGRQFGVHNATAMGNFGRQEYNKGSGIPQHREDWVFRVTYDYDSRYFLEYNGAYNGSEKFAEGNRFAFFNSGALGWMLSGEKFMENLRESKIIDILKIRASYGEIGDDSVNGLRFAYVSEFETGKDDSFKVNMGESKEKSPYYIFREKKVGNPDAHWEVVRKFNLGVDYSFLDGLVAGCVEIFRDKRTDIYIAGRDRAVPQYFGVDAPGANLGEVHNKGFEVEVRLNKTFNNGIHAWANLNFTHSENEVISMDDPEMLPDYRKKEGYAINQNRGYISGDFLQTYDDVYGSPKASTKDDFKMPGDYYLVDFNGDGKIDQNDQAPVGYSGIPQNTYNASLGVDWKGWNLFVQFYGVSNVTRNVPLTSFQDQLDNVYDLGTWWSESHNGAEYRTPFFSVQSYDGADGQQYTYDGSFLRLKNAELGYTFKSVDLGKFTVKNLKLYVSGNNLWLWTKMPDDRESYISGTGAANNGSYPTVKRVNFGLKFSF